MASKTTKFSVGIFVIVGLFLGVAFILYFGFSDLLKEGTLYAAYFDESVQGLDKDSAVKYRGVTVGRVESINVAPDDTLIEVILNTEENIKLEENIVAQLKPVGITGIMFVELDRIQDDEQMISPTLSFKPRYPVLKTKPSELKKTFDTLENILNQINSLDIKGISDRSILTLDNLNKTISDLQMDEISSNIQATFNRFHQIIDPAQWEALMKTTQSAGKSLDALILNMNRTVMTADGAIGRVDGIIRQNEADLTRAIQNFTASMEKANLFMSQGTNMMNQTGQTVEGIQRQIMTTLQNLEQASRNLNRTMEQLADQPSALIFSNPAPERD